MGGGSAEERGSSWRSLEGVWYLKGRNDPGCRETLVLQIEAFEEREDGVHRIC